VRQLTGRARLAQEPLHGDRVAGDTRPQDLDRDRAPELLVHAVVDYPHAAAPEHTLHEVPAVDDRANERISGLREGIGGHVIGSQKITCTIAAAEQQARFAARTAVARVIGA
jgi:hypothetical protein